MSDQPSSGPTTVSAPDNAAEPHSTTVAPTTAGAAERQTSSTGSTGSTHHHHHQGGGGGIRIQEPPERRPLLPPRAAFVHALDGDVYSCESYGSIPDNARRGDGGSGSGSENGIGNGSNSGSGSVTPAPHAPHRELPVYTNIHRIRRDVISVVEDYLSLDQLRDVRLNISVIRPLVDKLYEQDDISIVYCLLVNRAQFLSEQAHLTNRQNVNFTRAMLCELIATRILRRFNEDNEGPRNLLVLAHILIAGFEPFQNAPEEIRREVGASTAHHRTLPALEVAILSESRVFLASTSCQKIVDAIYEGRVVYTPSSFMDIIPDRYKQRPISLYNPREAPLLNHYRLVVPRTRNFLEITHFVVLLVLYLAFMSEREAKRITKLEVCFTVYAMGWVLDQFATLLEHGWDVYAQNLWSFLDVTFGVIYGVYFVLRLYSWGADSFEAGQQALDVLAIGAPVLIPRLAFNLLSDNLVFLSLRSMMSDFAVLSALAIWCFLGFLLSLVWLGNGHFGAGTISKWMIYIWFGLDGSGISRSADFHQILGPALMITFAFLGNTLFLTILVSMLSTTFSHIVNNAPAEIQFRRAVMTLEGVKGDAIFAYPPPFNVLAILVLVPLKFCVSARWFHKIHVLSVRLINLPILLVIAVAERRSLSPHSLFPSSVLSSVPSVSKSINHHPVLRIRRRFWDRWRITTHSDISTVFEIDPPDSVLGDIAADDDMTRHLIRRQFTAAAPKLDPQHQMHVHIQQPLPHPRPGLGPSASSSPALTKPTQPQSQSQPRTSQPQPPTPGLTQHQHQQPLPTPGFIPGSLPLGTTPTPTATTTTLKRRDSIAPFPGLRAELQGVLSESDEVSDITSRLEALEASMARMEGLLVRFVGGGGNRAGMGGNTDEMGGGNGGDHGVGGNMDDAGVGIGLGMDMSMSSAGDVAVEDEEEENEEGGERDRVPVGGRRRSMSLAELNREAEEE